MISPKDGMTLLYIPAGEFIMGSDEGKYDERPARTVYLDAFWIDRTEVTNEMFATFLNSQGNQIQYDVNWLDSLSRYVRIHPVTDRWQADSGFEDHPVVEVNWFSAQAYCSWVSRRLPTQEEWEKVASWDDISEEKYIYPWGNDFNGTFLNFCDKNCENQSQRDLGSDDGYVEISPVDMYPEGVSPYGVFGLAGNVSEWVSDWYRKNSYGNLFRVIRGGSWYYEAKETYRIDGRNPLFTWRDLGFRCAASG